MFALESYSLNFHAFPSLIIGLLTLLMGIFVALQKNRSKANFLFFLICLSVCVWLLATAMGLFANQESVAVQWFKIDNFGVLFISINIYLFSRAFLGLKIEAKHSAAYPLAFIIGILVLSSDWLVVGARKFYWGYFPRWGFLSVPVFLIFFSYMGASFSILLNHFFRGNLTPLKKNQAKYLMVGFLLGYTGASDFLPTFGIMVYPFGCFSYFAFLLIVAFLIVRHRLMAINIVLTRAGILFSVYLPVAIIPFWLARRYLSTPMWWYPILLMGILATLGPFIYFYLRNRADAIFLKDQRRYQGTLRRLSATMTLVKDLDRLLKLVVYRVSRVVKVEFACIYLVDAGQDKLIRKSVYITEGFSPDLPEELEFKSNLTAFLKERRKPVFAEELGFHIRKDFFLKSGLVVPSFMRERFLGFLVLGPKLSAAIYTQEDAVVFEILANQIAMAIENTEFISESQKTQSQLFAAERMASLGTMAGGMSHQLNNRFHAIALATSDTLDVVGLLDLEKAPKEEVKGTLDHVAYALQRIQENVKHGGKIINNFLNFSQPDRVKRESKQFDIKEPLERAIEMVKIKRSVGAQTIEIEVREPLPLFQGDFVLVQDVFFNLIDNAIDAMIMKQRAMQNNDKDIPNDPEYKGIIKVKLSPLPNAIMIHMQDNGIGMSDDTKRRIFVPFFTSKATSMKGTGLGLFVIQKIIDAHQGQIKVNSEYGKGTEFTIILPLKSGGG